MTNVLPPRGVGRPRKYPTPESFWEAAEKYFEMCDLADPEPEQYTITGLALALGLSSRQELYDYANYEGYEDVTARARMKVEHAYEKRLQKAMCTGAIFALKNMGWRDERHVDVKDSTAAAAGQPKVLVDWSRINTDALAQMFTAMTEQKAERPKSDRPDVH